MEAVSTITIYGSDQCPKTLKIVKLCRERGIEVEYRCFERELKSLWEFVIKRDTATAFDEAKKCGRLGIPAIIFEDGSAFDGGTDPFDAERTMIVIEENL